MAAQTIKEQVKNPAFWATIITALGAVGSGLMEVGNPVTIAIGAAVTAIYTIAQKLENTSIAAQQQIASQAIPAIQSAIQAGKQGDYAGAVEKAGALVPIVEQQVSAVQTLIDDVRSQISIINYKLHGYEVTPHEDAPSKAPAKIPSIAPNVGDTTTITQAPKPAVVDSTGQVKQDPAPVKLQIPGGAHEVIGRGT